MTYHQHLSMEDNWADQLTDSSNSCPSPLPVGAISITFIVQRSKPHVSQRSIQIEEQDLIILRPDDILTTSADKKKEIRSIESRSVGRFALVRQLLGNEQVAVTVSHLPLHYLRISWYCMALLYWQIFHPDPFHFIAQFINKRNTSILDRYTNRCVWAKMTISVRNIRVQNFMCGVTGPRSKSIMNVNKYSEFFKPSI